jgi:similar to stage IV sporulation protein
MGMFSLTRFVRGQLRLALNGPSVERFIQAAVHSGVGVWNVTRHGERCEASVDPSDFRRLRPLARRTGTRVRIIRKTGLPFRMRGPAREAVFTGLIIFVAVLYLLGAFVWRIELTGLVTLSEDQVLQALDRAGLRAGQPKRLVQPQEVERGLLMAFPEVSWVAVSLEGAVARVQILEKLTREQVLENMLPADIVAGKNGAIQTLIVMQGQAKVAEGQRVSQGQIIIAGEPGLWDYRGRTMPPDVWPPAAVRARGIVLARVVYDLSAEAPLERTLSVRTGKHTQSAVLRVGVREIILSGQASPPFEFYEQTRHCLAWRGGSGDVVAELVAVTYHELERVHEVLGPRGARLEAEAQAKQELGRRLVPGSAIVSEQVLEYERPDAVGVRLLVEAVEEIGRTRVRESLTP